MSKHGPGKKSTSVYFAGCTASYVAQDIAMSRVRLLDPAGVDFTYLGPTENCCATPMLVLMGNDLYHPESTSRELAELAPNAELVERWKEPEAIPGTVKRVRAFLKAHS